MNIIKGLPDKFKSSAAELLLNALEEKFIPILGDKNKAKQLLELSIKKDNCFSIEDRGELLGILAYQIDKNTFLSPSLKSIISIYGLFGGFLKTLGLSMLTHKTETDEIYIEAVAVCELSRGKGIGSKLFESFFHFANANEFKTISLEVIDINPGAKKLYEKLGFKVIKKSKIWPLNKIFGWPFNEVFSMKKDIKKT